MLVNGKWTDSWTPYQGTNSKGEFIRQTSSFRNWITADGSEGPTGTGGYRAEPNRYHIYVALICPWASRVLATLAIKGLEDVISVDIVDPRLGDQGWEFSNFPGSKPDRLHNTQALHQLYSLADPKYTGKATVPLLWDKETDTAVNNESADIIEMLNSAFEPWATNKIDLRPEKHLHQIKELNQFIYENINNGVYRCGFAQTQEAYEEAYEKLFNALDKMEERMENSKFIFGDSLTETDVRLFVTLVRFDAAYFGLFKTNKRSMSGYPNLYSYMQRIYAIPGIEKTVNIDHIKNGYYSIRALNPKGIVPKGISSLI